MRLNFKISIYVLIIFIFMISCYHMNNPFAPTNIITEAIEDGTIKVSLSGADAKNGNLFYFLVYDKPILDNTKDYIAKNSFAIIDGGGSAFALDPSDDTIKKFKPGKNYNILGFIGDAFIGIQLEDATDLSNYNTVGYFKGGITLKDDSGNDLIEGTDYKYDLPLNSGIYDIYDNNDSGIFSVGRYFRIVHDSDNITDVMDLVPIAKDLTVVSAPDGTHDTIYRSHMYIDPAKGKFVLPRPIYWSKIESELNITTTPELTESNISFSLDKDLGPSGTISYPSGIFGNCIEFHDANNNIFDHGVTIEESTSKDWSKGTFECWAKFYALSSTNEGGEIYMIDKNKNIGIRFRSGNFNTDAELFVNNILQGTYSSLSNGTWYHFYIVWDNEGELDSGSKTVRVFIDSAERLNSSIVIATTSFKINTLVGVYGSGASGTIHSYVDNIKIWDYVVSEDPSWCYNFGSGREDALHECYGSGNGYKPDPDNIEVGYFAIGSSAGWPDTGEMTGEK